MEQLNIIDAIKEAIEGEKEKKRKKRRKWEQEYYQKNKTECIRKVRERLKTRKGVVELIYIGQKNSSKERKHPPPDYSKQELIDKFMYTPKFEKLYNEWVVSGYKTSQKPSIDRIDYRKPYTLNNLQLLTWEKNFAKANIEISKPVDMYKDGKKTRTFGSMVEASQRTGIGQQVISKCCRGRTKKTRCGHQFRYAEEQWG